MHGPQRDDSLGSLPYCDNHSEYPACPFWRARFDFYFKVQASGDLLGILPRTNSEAGRAGRGIPFLKMKQNMHLDSLEPLSDAC